MAEMAAGNQPAAEAEFRGMDRLKFFSDAVFAIAITLLTLDLVLPRGTVPRDLAHNLGTIWPQYVAFAFTFLLIGLRWLTHLVQFRYIRSYDYMLLGLNLGLLCAVAFIPFASKVLADYPDSRSACVLYAASMAVAGLISTAIWWHACHRADLIDSELDQYTQRNLLFRWAVLPVFFGVAIVLALVAPSLWLARAVALFTPVVQIGLAMRQARVTGHPV